MPDKIINDLKKRMENSLNAFHNDLKTIRTGRASASMLDSVNVEVYGSKMPINQVATVSAPEPRLVSVQVWDQNNLASVEKAIANSGLGLNPMSEGNVVRVPIPDLSEERRKDLSKVAHQYAERSKVSIRNIRRDGMDALKKLEKDSVVSQDEQHKKADDIQKITDEYIKNIDESLAVKEKDIMEV